MGPVRMISSGHELTTDYDEKTLHELGFKDMQVTVCFLFPVYEGQPTAGPSAHRFKSERLFHIFNFNCASGNRLSRNYLWSELHSAEDLSEPYLPV